MTPGQEALMERLARALERSNELAEEQILLDKTAINLAERAQRVAEQRRYEV